MNIKDIARLAGVSASTVSKVINEKDDNISPETIEKVLSIVKKYNYVPYAGLRSIRKQRSFLLAVLISYENNQCSFLKGVISQAQSQGYQVIINISHTKEEEYQNLANLLSHHVDGLLWNQRADSLPECMQLIDKRNLPVLPVFSSKKGQSISLNYTALGYYAAQILLAHKHRHILCLIENETLPNQLLVQGAQQCLFDLNIPLDSFLVKNLQEKKKGQLFIPASTTAVLCSSSAGALQVVQEAHKSNRRVPKDLSLIALSEEKPLPDVSTITLPYEDLGIFACKQLINVIEGQENLFSTFEFSPRINQKLTIDVPLIQKRSKIIVLGTLNIDTIITTPRLPHTGETIRSPSRATLPGGTGINQATGAARLGADVYLLGKIGKDHGGNELFYFLKDNHIHTQGVFSTSKANTGQAYIFVEDNAESGIVIYAGANEQLTHQELESQKEVFESASYCLLQTEMSFNLVLHAATLAKEAGCQIILKPSAVTHLPDELLSLIDILIPNEKELATILPGSDSFEQKADFFIQKGVDTVIITLGSQGGYVKNQSCSKYFPAADFTVLDTTGAADAFCATLAVYLSQNHDLATSLFYANVAAGYSTTHFGAAPSFVEDKATLDFLVEEQKKLKEEWMK